jgi:hypothetical protein
MQAALKMMKENQDGKVRMPEGARARGAGGMLPDACGVRGLNLDVLVG